MARKEENENGTVIYRDDDGKYHREDGPAIEYSSGFKIYYNHGKKMTKEEFEGKDKKESSWRGVLSWDVRPTKKDLSYLRSVFPDLGCMDTGGGCTALYKTYNDGYEVFITGASNPNHVPENDETHLNIGFMDPDGIWVIPDYMIVGTPHSEYNEQGDQHWIPEDLTPDEFLSDSIPIEQAIEFLHKFSEYHD